MSRRALIIGSSGFIGRYLCQSLARREVTLGTYYRRQPGAVEWIAKRLDVTDAASVEALMQGFRPKVVINLAAEPVVDKVTEGAEAAWRVSVAGTENVAEAAAKFGALLLLVSSDYVFDGSGGPYAEDAPCRPSSAYGRMKLAAENAVRMRAPEHLIVRTSLVYGWPMLGHHANLASTLVDRLRRGQRFTAYTDMIRTPIYVSDLVDVLGSLLGAGARGVYHVGSRNAVSIHEFALAVCDVLHLRRGLLLAAASATDGAARPRACGLRTDKAAHNFGIEFPTTGDGLRRMKEEEVAHD